MHRQSPLSLLVIVLSLTVLFQNCTRVNTSSGTSSSSASTHGLNESGNAGGYGGKPYVEIANFGDCANGQKVRARIILSDGGGAVKTVENCLNIAPVTVASADLRLSADASTIDLLGRLFISETTVNVSLSCFYTSQSGSTWTEEKLTVGQTKTGYVAFVHRYLKSATGYTYLESPLLSVIFEAVGGNATQSEFSGSSSNYQMLVSPFDSTAYASQPQLTTSLRYQVPLTDLSTGQTASGQNGAADGVTCSVYR